MRRALLAASAIAVVLGGTSGVAYGSGFQIDIHDATGTGRSFAYTAGVDNAAAGYFNPAAISLFEETRLKFGGTFLTSQIEYDPSGAGRSDATDRLNATIPHLYLSVNASEVVDFGFAYFTPFALRTDWPHDWTGRYLALKNEVTFNFLQPYVSFNLSKIVDGLSIAVGPQFVLAANPLGGSGVRLNQAIDLRWLGEPDGEMLIKGDTDGINVGYVVALHYAPPFLGGRVKLGASWRATPDDHEIEGEAEFRMSPSARAATNLPHETDAETDLTLPPWFQVGVEVEVVEDFLWVEVDYKWTGWSTLDTLEIDFKDPTVADREIDFDWEDVHMVMVGAEVQATEWLRLRAGYFYDTTPVPDRTLGPRLPDADRHGMSVGAGFDLGPVRIDLAYMKLFPDTAVKANAEGTDLPGGPQPANGRYDTNIDLFSLSLEVEF